LIEEAPDEGGVVDNSAVPVPDDEFHGKQVPRHRWLRKASKTSRSGDMAQRFLKEGRQNL
jgi:hypothetical protein